MDRFILAPYVTFGFLEEKLRCGSGSIQKIIADTSLHELYLHVAAFFKNPHSIQEAHAEFHSLQQSGDLQKVLDDFLSSHFLIRQGDYTPAARYSRHALYYLLSGADPQCVQRRITESHVVLIGCGGIGNVLGLLLTCAGVGQLTLVDEDQIELSNLTRQVLFTEDDVGLSKLQVASQALQARNRSVTVVPFPRWIKSSNDLQDIPKADLWVLSADKPRDLVYWVNAHCLAIAQPYIPAGYVQDVAVWGPLVIPGQTGCFTCQKIIADTNCHELLETINRGYQAPSFGPINMLAASAAALDILRYLGKYGTIQCLNKRMGIFSNDMHLESQDCSKNIACATCAAHVTREVA